MRTLLVIASIDCLSLDDIEECITLYTVVSSCHLPCGRSIYLIMLLMSFYLSFLVICIIIYLAYEIKMMMMMMIYLYSTVCPLHRIVLYTTARPQSVVRTTRP